MNCYLDKQKDIIIADQDEVMENCIYVLAHLSKEYKSELKIEQHICLPPLPP